MTGSDYAKLAPVGAAFAAGQVGTARKFPSKPRGFPLKGSFKGEIGTDKSSSRL